MSDFTTADRLKALEVRRAECLQRLDAIRRELIDRLPRQRRLELVAERQELSTVLAAIKLQRNELNATKNDARRGYFVDIVIEQFAPDVVEAIWREADRRVIAAAERRIANASAHVGAALPTVGASGTPRVRTGERA